MGKNVFWPIINVSRGLPITIGQFGVFKLVLGCNIRPLKSKMVTTSFFFNFPTIPTFPAKSKVKTDFLSKTKAAELILSLKPLLWPLTGPNWAKIDRVMGKSVKNMV